jgi:predicted DNA-binding protein
MSIEMRSSANNVKRRVKLVRNAAIGIRVKPELKTALEKAAKDDGRTVASYVERILISHINNLENKK